MGAVRSIVEAREGAVERESGVVEVARQRRGFPAGLLLLRKWRCASIVCPADLTVRIRPAAATDWARRGTPILPRLPRSNEPAEIPDEVELRREALDKEHDKLAAEYEKVRAKQAQRIAKLDGRYQEAARKYERLTARKKENEHSADERREAIEQLDWLAPAPAVIDDGDCDDSDGPDTYLPRTPPAALTPDLVRTVAEAMSVVIEARPGETLDELIQEWNSRAQRWRDEAKRQEKKGTTRAAREAKQALREAAIAQEQDTFWSGQLRPTARFVEAVADERVRLAASIVEATENAPRELIADLTDFLERLNDLGCLRFRGTSPSIYEWAGPRDSTREVPWVDIWFARQGVTPAGNAPASLFARRVRSAPKPLATARHPTGLDQLKEVSAVRIFIALDKSNRWFLHWTRPEVAEDFVQDVALRYFEARKHGATESLAVLVNRASEATRKAHTRKPEPLKNLGKYCTPVESTDTESCGLLDKGEELHGIVRPTPKTTSDEHSFGEREYGYA
jgi:hypothetical protein